MLVVITSFFFCVCLKQGIQFFLFVCVLDVFLYYLKWERCACCALCMVQFTVWFFYSTFDSCDIFNQDRRISSSEQTEMCVTKCWSLHYCKCVCVCVCKCAVHLTFKHFKSSKNSKMHCIKLTMTNNFTHKFFLLSKKPTEKKKIWL